MKLLKMSKQENLLIVVPQTLDDLWHLEKILEPGDIVTGQTERKIKPKVAGQEPMRITMFLDLELKEVFFDKFLGQMRLSGIIVAGKPEEFVELKAHHTISVELGEKLKIQKKELKQYHLDRLKKAEASMKKPKLLLIVLDDEQADFGLLSDYGLDHKLTISAERQGKQFAEANETKYFQQILEKIKFLNLNKIILAGPGFVKENLKKFLEDKNFEGQIVLETANNVGITGLNELLKNGLADKVIQDFEVIKETNLFNSLLAEIGKNSGKAEYGFDAVKSVVDLGAVQDLLVSSDFLKDNREQAEQLMNLVESMKGQIHVISVEHDAGLQLKNLSGIAALLRYKVK